MATAPEDLGYHRLVEGFKQPNQGWQPMGQAMLMSPNDTKRWVLQLFRKYDVAKAYLTLLLASRSKKAAAAAGVNPVAPRTRATKKKAAAKGKGKGKEPAVANGLEWPAEYTAPWVGSKDVYFDTKFSVYVESYNNNRAVLAQECRAGFTRQQLNDLTPWDIQMRFYALICEEIAPFDKDVDTLLLTSRPKAHPQFDNGKNVRLNLAYRVLKYIYRETIGTGRTLSMIPTSLVEDWQTKPGSVLRKMILDFAAALKWSPLDQGEVEEDEDHPPGEDERNDDAEEPRPRRSRRGNPIMAPAGDAAGAKDAKTVHIRVWGTSHKIEVSSLELATLADVTRIAQERIPEIRSLKSTGPPVDAENQLDDEHEIADDEALQELLYGDNAEAEPKISVQFDIVNMKMPALNGEDYVAGKQFWERTPEWQDEMFERIRNELTGADEVQTIDRSKAQAIGADLADHASGEVTDEQAERRRETFEMYQKSLGLVQVGYINFDACRKRLIDVVGKDCQLVEGIPDKRQGKGRDKIVAHLPHQLLFLAWAIDKYHQHGGGICADTMGMGKSHEIVALILLIQHVASEKQKSLPADRRRDHGPTLLAVPATLRSAWLKILSTEFLGLFGDPLTWRVFLIGSNESEQPEIEMRNRSVVMSQDSPAMRHPGAADHKIFLVTYEQLSKLKREDMSQLKGVFERVILDEAHECRNTFTSSRGLAVLAIAAKERWSFTGTPTPNNIADFGGLLRFHQRDHWGDTRNLNRMLCHLNGRPKRDTKDIMYAAFEQNSDVPTPAEITEAKQEKEHDQWHVECPSPDRCKDRCNHFPILERLNTKHGKRPRSVNAADRRALPLDPEVKQARKEEKEKQIAAGNEPEVAHRPEVKAPFDENPFDTYHKENKNRRRCLTVEAWYYYIVPHLPKKRTKDRPDSPGRPDLVRERMTIIIEELMICRNPYSTYIKGGKECTLIADTELGQKLKHMEVNKVRLKWTQDEAKAHEGRTPATVENWEVGNQAAHFQKFGKIISREAHRKRAKHDAKVAGYKARLADDANDSDGDDVQVPEDEKADEGADDETSDKEFSKRTAGFHKFLALSTSQCLPGIRGVETRILNKCKLGLPSLLLLMYVEGRGGNPEWKDFKGFTDDFDVLQKALWGSPVFRQALSIIHDTQKKPEGTRRKVLIMFHLPRSAVFFNTILQFMGINSELLTADIDPQERGKRFGLFNDSPDNAQVLIATYGLRLAGLNGHEQCCTFIAVEPAFNLATEQQAFYRIRRWGQDEIQKVYRLHQNKSYRDVHEMAVERKSFGIAVALGFLSAAKLKQGLSYEDFFMEESGGEASERFSNMLETLQPIKEEEDDGDKYEDVDAEMALKILMNEV